MKKKLLVTCSVLAVSLISAADLHAQGTIIFANAPGSLIMTNNPVGYAYDFQVALYWAPLGSDESDLVQIGSPVSSPAFPPAVFNGGTYTTPSGTAPGQDALFQVRGWTGNYSSYEDALLSGDPDVLVGVSDMWQNHTGNPSSVPPLPPPSLSAGPGTFSGVLLDTP